MKTNKSLTKRFKISGSGKLIARKPGKDHFNAKASGQEKMSGKRKVVFKLKNKDKGKYLPNLVK